MPQGQLVAPARRTMLGDDGNQIAAHSALPHSALERLFSGIHFGMDDGQYGLPKNNFAG
jgi:hypothetical protein